MSGQSGMSASSWPQDEIITVTQGGGTETVSVGSARPGQTVVVTVGGEVRTVTIAGKLTVESKLKWLLT